MTGKTVLLCNVAERILLTAGDATLEHAPEEVARIVEQLVS